MTLESSLLGEAIFPLNPVFSTNVFPYREKDYDLISRLGDAP